MSLFHPVNLVCPNCAALVTMEAVGSVNADRRPDLREDIANDRFQDVTCGSCAHRFRLPPEFNFLDVGRGQWIAAMPARRIGDWVALEDEVNTLYANSYGVNAPEAARVVGEGLTVRLTFGWPAVREKLLLAQEGLDDVVIELIKLDLMRRLSDAPFGAGIALRVVRVTGEVLAFAWITSDTEAGGDEVTVERDVYDQMIATAQHWKKLRGRLETGPFVDIQKLYVGQGRAAAAAPEPALAGE